ncbi:MAG: methyltransferase domain-containing protein [Oscillibacter sp.]|uniref:class I SAM-dependent methyltransferase n=1 Tax=Oscillibacter sp. TaxID=1945593 RepID=UPI00216C95EE|nr:methyltransferase domain-containing protein [Oscillibacter sp.]MCI9112707.1 methyltransferase domain-containing protein [Oscillibacter sp.]
MVSLNLNNGSVAFTGLEGTVVLLDSEKPLENKSRVSMHRLADQKHPIISDILLKLIQRQQEEEADLAVPFGLLDALLTVRLIRSSKPVRVLEYGSGQGELSVHLAELLGTFHEESMLVCAHDTIELEWMERISHVEHLPKLSFLAGDFGALGLQSNSFHMVVLNGRTDFQNPYEVVADALRLVRKDGVIFCYTDDCPLLESVFKLFFELREEFVLQPSQKILLADVENVCWQAVEPPHIDVNETGKLVKKSIRSGRKAALSAMEVLKSNVDAVARMGEADKKIQLLEQKEKLLEYITRS